LSGRPGECDGLAAEDRDRLLLLQPVVAPMFLCSSVAMAAEAFHAAIVGSLTRDHLRNHAGPECGRRATGALWGHVSLPA